MPKLMQRHDQKKRQILGDTPADRGILSRPALDFINRYQKPRPVEKHIHPGKLKQADGSAASAWHARSLLDFHKQW